jgi:histone deacetylase 1/2
LSNHDISHYTTAPHTPQQNGVTEKRHRHLIETGLTLLHDASLSISYWPHAFQTTAYLINHQPTLLQNKSPFEVLFRQQPIYLKLRKFGCLCYPLTKPYNTHKLQPKSIPSVFIGYSPTQNAYKCIDPSTARIYLSKHVLFDETQSPVFKNNPPSQISSTRPPDHTYLFLKPNSCPVISSPTPLVLAPSSPTSNLQLKPSMSLDTVTAFSASSPGITPSLSPPLCESHDNLHYEHLSSNFHVSPASTFPLPCPTQIASIPTHNHSMTTRSMNNIFKHKQLKTIFKHSLPPFLEPTCMSQAVSHPEWRIAMSSKLTALMSHGT